MKPNKQKARGVAPRKPMQIEQAVAVVVPEERFLKTKEAARFLRLAEQTLVVARCTKTGIQIPYVKIGGRVLYDREDLERFVESSKRMQTEGCAS